MMKNRYKFLVVICILCTVNITAQEVPNGGFETWETSDIWVNNPLNWTTDNTEVTSPVVPDSAAFAGELCMTLVPDANALGVGDALAETIFEFNDLPETLFFYARWNFVAGQVGLNFAYLNDTVEVASTNWSPDEFESTSDWQLIQMSLPLDDVFFTHCKISCYAIVGDLAVATISFDEMAFDIANGIGEEHENFLSLGPNPSNDLLIIKTKNLDKLNSRIIVFDALGKEVYSSVFANRLDVSTLPNGQYILVIQADDKRVQKKFIVQH